jgi:hypothetical protein
MPEPYAKPMCGDIPPKRIARAVQLAPRPFHTLSALDQQRWVDKAKEGERKTDRQAASHGATQGALWKEASDAIE